MHQKLACSSRSPSRPASAANEMVAVQALIKERLPQALADPDNKMQTASGMAIAVIVKYEFPDGWPQLLPSLVQAITARRSSSEGANEALKSPVAVAGSERKSRIQLLGPSWVQPSVALLHRFM